jgi:tetratricopeptide (TPR) repeat protein
VALPPQFLVDRPIEARFLHNLPQLDYEPDGGFVGRKEDLAHLRQLITGDLDRVITVCGAGGVGKTALAHRLCASLLQEEAMHFGAIVWMSAKEETLSLTGIEPITPSIRNYEEVLDRILGVYGWDDVVQLSLEEKEEFVKLVLEDEDRGILLVVDNLETVEDQRIIDFIKDIPRPNKVLITSRIGLGEVERRQELREMAISDAVALTRVVAREKGANALASLPDSTLKEYVRRMSSYPLAIKWVVGQVALGKDINELITSLGSASSDVARFCFDHIYHRCLSGEARLLMACLAASDEPLTRGILTHVSGLAGAVLDGVLRELLLSSLVVMGQKKTTDDEIVTEFSLLPITWGYAKAQLKSDPTLHARIDSAFSLVRSQIERVERREFGYRYDLNDLGATTDEERAAAFSALTANRKYQSGDYSGAVAAFERALQIAPGLARIYRNWAVVESDEGRYSRAAELLERAIAIEPTDASLHFAWGNMEKRRGECGEACVHYQKALELVPDDMFFMSAYADAMKRVGEHEKADAFFAKALVGAESRPEPYHRLVVLTSWSDNSRRWSESLLAANRSEEALHQARQAYDRAWQAVQLAMRDEKALETMGKAAYEYARQLVPFVGIEKALPYFRRAISDRPRGYRELRMTALACEAVAWHLLRAGYVDEGRVALRKGERTSPDNLRWNELREALEPERVDGKITEVRAARGFGFILPLSNPELRVFFHVTRVVSPDHVDDLGPYEGCLVSYVPYTSERGNEAAWVVINPKPASVSSEEQEV